MGLKFSYTPKLTDFGTIHTPLVDVVFSHPKTRTSVEILALIDSGADAIVLNAQFADVLGLPLTEGKEQAYRGISSGPVVAYQHTLNLRLKAARRNTYTVPCSFLPDLPAACILGQEGFFQNYDVLFQLSKKRFEITPVRKKNSGDK